MNKELFDIRNCCIMELSQYDYFMKRYYELITERNELQDRIDSAINYIEENCYDEERKMVINELYNEIPELLDILKGENK